MNVSQITPHIYENFCLDCKNKAKCKEEGKLFISFEGICGAFEWKSDADKAKYQKEVLHSQAVTIWLEKGKPLSAVHRMTQKELLSVLTKAHYQQFDQFEKRKQQALDALKAAPVEEKALSPTTTNKVHYFYCTKLNSDKVVYKRNTNTKSYESEVKAFRKYLASIHIKIDKEEIK